LKVKVKFKQVRLLI